MNISGSSMAAFGFATLLGVTGFALFDARNQFSKSQETVANLQSERDRLNKQVETLESDRDRLNKEIESMQKQVNASNNRASTLEGKLSESENAAEVYQGQIETLSVCLQGVAEGMNQISQDNPAGAIITFSSVSKDCRKSDKIMQERNSSDSRQEQTVTSARSTL